MDAIRSDLITFIEQRTGARAIQWARTSPIEQTLGMAELDTIVFYEEFVKQFNVQIPPDWNISDHVSPVVFHDWRHYFKKIFSKSYRQQATYIDLTFGDLEDMVKAGIWKDIQAISGSKETRESPSKA